MSKINWATVTDPNLIRDTHDLPNDTTTIAETQLRVREVVAIERIARILEQWDCKGELGVVASVSVDNTVLVEKP